jgi:hypothetical protein
MLVKVWGSGKPGTILQPETSNDRVSRWSDRQSFIPSILAAAVLSGRATEARAERADNTPQRDVTKRKVCI